MKVLQTEFTENEIEIINSVIRNGNIGFGSNVEVFETEFQKYSNKKFNISVNSASAAAFIIFSYLREKYGTCDVYTPSLAFTSPAWCAKHFGHNLIFVDVNDDLVFDCKDYLTKRSNTGNKPVVMPILYGGISCIPEWNIIGDEIVVVDSAHGITPTIECDYVFFSFHPTKPVCTSDGGTISTNDEHSAKYFYNYRNFGRIASVSGYDINQEGFKFYMNNLNATIGLVSLNNYYRNVELRKSNHDDLYKLFTGRFLEHDENSSYYFATLITDDAKSINDKYGLAIHYPLLHKMTYYNNNISLPNTEKLHTKIVNLPLYENIYNW